MLDDPWYILRRRWSLFIADISRSVGFDDPLHFSKVFIKAKGLPPKEFRKKVMEGLNKVV